MFTTSTMRVRANFGENRLLQSLCGVYLMVWIVTAIGPLHPDDWLLENVLVFTFMILHSAGAHYTYAEVPYGFWLKDVLNLSRNHYDRIVHLGILSSTRCNSRVQRAL
mgnify:CR=1 FL=1